MVIMKAQVALTALPMLGTVVSVKVSHFPRRLDRERGLKTVVSPVGYTFVKDTRL